MSNVTRAIVLTDASASDNAAATAITFLEAHAPVVAMSARDAFNAYQMKAGVTVRGFWWDAWVKHAVSSFDLFVRPYNAACGRVTARIAGEAVRCGKLVVLLADEKPQVRRVVAVQETDAENWTGGWTLITEGQRQ
tara:strand:+ start:170 stop:577 length:408 start_codon:yes stop_codon:yes gene_type:complete